MTRPRLDHTRLATRCVHAGHRPSAAERSLVTPIVRSTTFLLDEAAYRLREAGRSEEARVYSRESYPGLEALEVRLAALEGAEGAVAFGSGQAALHAALLAALPPGKPLLASDRLYGGSLALLAELLPRQGSPLVRFAPDDPADLSRKLPPGGALVLVESLSNPDLCVADLPGLAEVCRRAGARLLVDATFVSPALQRPLEHGADLVMHSATKYLGGHSDLLGGVLAGGGELLAQARRWRTLAGAVLDPQAAFLLERGLKTLALRLAAQCAGAEELARRLAAHPEVQRVLYPSLASERQRGLARRLLARPGAMVSFELAGGDPRAGAFARALRLILEAASLGGVESLISLPARMSHVGLSPEQRLAAGIGPGQVRLSVGIEDPLDLWADLEQALAHSAAPASAPTGD
jgi:cystathionine beta-lyase/cystathionine gamma-synthase